MISKNNFRMLLTGLMLMVFIAVRAQFTVGLVKYTIRWQGELYVTATWAENGPDDVVVIPPTVEYHNKTYTVTHVTYNEDFPIYQLVISEGIKYDWTEYPSGLSYAPALPHLKRLELPGSTKTIPLVFQDCPVLEELVLNEGIETIPSRCFLNSRIRHLHIPASVKEIWGPCSSHNLETITVDPANEYYYSYNNTLINKKLNSVVLGNKSMFLPDFVEGIQDFAYNMISSTGEIGRAIDVIIPDHIQWLSRNAYSIDSINTIYIPRTTKISPYRSFYCHYLKEIIVADGDEFFHGDWYLAASMFYVINKSSTPVIDNVYIGRSKNTSYYLLDETVPHIIKKMTLGPKVAFYWDYTNRQMAIESLHSLITNPETCSVRFGEEIYKNTPLYVPKGTKEFYMVAEGWENFSVIEEEGTPTGIKSAISDNPYGFGGDEGKAGYYSLEGKPLGEPRKGVNIVRLSNGKTKKVVVR